jgi:ABC-type lipoprotein release transport system permease subunit
MNFVNRAFKNVTRRMSKTVLLTLTFFLIGNLVIIGLGVSNAAESAKILTRQKMRAVVTYGIDYNKVYQYTESLDDEDEINAFYENYPRVKLEEVSEFLKDERVKTANATSANMWYNDFNNTLDFVHLNNRAEENMGNTGNQCYYDEEGKEICESYREPYFFIKGNMFPSMIEFEDGDYQLVNGRFYTQQEIDSGSFVCIISENLANTNNVSVGDSIRLATNYLSNYLTESGVTAEDLENDFEVIGIFSHNNPITPDATNYEYCYPYENPDNMIFMPSTSVYVANLLWQQKRFDYYKNLEDTDLEYYNDPKNRPSMDNMEEQMYLDNVTLLLSDPLDVDQFVEDYKGSLSQFTSLSANNEEFNNLAKPLDTLSMYANFIIWLVIVNAIVIITLVTALTLKTREYEIGVLLSIGASKFKVIAQFFLELAIVAIIGFTLSIISGSLIAKRIGNTVLEYQIASSGVNGEDEFSYISNGFNPWDNDYSSNITLDDLVAEYEVHISPLIIGEIYVLGLAIVLLSVVIPSFMIMRYNPKKILMNQN